MNTTYESFKRGLKIVIVGWFVSFCSSYSQQSPVMHQAPQEKARVVPSGAAEPDTLKPASEIGTHGNWYKKRDWLLKANEVNNQIQDMASQAEDLRSVFMSKWKSIDKILDNYYVNDGLEQGKIQELFESVNKYVEKQRKKERESLEKQTKADTTMQAKIEFVENKMSVYKQELEQLKLDMKSIEDLDQSLMERLKRFDEQIGIIDQEAEKAAKSVDSLWDVLDDLKAREQYYVLNNDIFEHVKVIYGYLKDDLLSDFDSVIATINDQIAKNKDAIGKLEGKGLIIKDRARRIKEIKLKELEQLEKQKAQQVLDEQRIAAEKARKELLKEPERWYEKILKPIRETASIIYKIFAGIWDAVTSYWSKPTPKPAQPTPEASAGKPASTAQPTGVQQQTTLPTQPTPTTPPTSPIIPAIQEQPQAIPSPAVQSQMPITQASNIPTMMPQAGPEPTIEDVGTVPDEMPAAVAQQ